MSLTIEIRDSANSVEGTLDIGKDEDFPFSLTKKLASIRNIDKRGGVYSKTFRVPATKDNNQLLENLYSSNQKPVKGMREKKTALVLVNDIVIERGYVKVVDITTKGTTKVYELQFFGNNVAWMSDLSDTKLNELAFVNNAQTYNATNIAVTWTGGFDSGYDHVYPLISYGSYKEKDKVIVRDMRPAIYYRAIVERALNKVGFTLSSTFMDDADFKKLILPYVGDKFRNLQSVMDAKKFRASPVATLDFLGQIINWSSGLPLGAPTKVIFDDDSTGDNYDLGSNYSILNSEYVASQKGNYKFAVMLKGKTSTYSVGWAIIYLFKNGSQLAQIEKVLTFTQSGFLKFRTPVDTGFFTLEQGDVIDVRVIFWYDTVPSGSTMTMDTRSWWSCTEMDKELFDGNAYNISDVLPEIPVLDLFADLTKLFNLYWRTDNKTNTVYVEDRNNFFAEVDTAIDWSDKIDVGSDYGLNFISDYKREVLFHYKKDSNDKWLEARNDTFNYTNNEYCSYKHVLPDRFRKGDTKIVTSQLSPTHFIIDNNATGTEVPPLIARMWNKANPDNDPPETFYNFNPRILNFNNAIQNWDNENRSWNWEGTESLVIPSALPMDAVEQTVPFRLSFAQNDGLFNTYYNRTFSTIEDGIRLTAKFNLKTTDYQSFDIRKPIYLASPEELHGYWIIDTIKDYSPLKPLTTIELIRYHNQDVLFQPIVINIDWGLPPLVTSTGGNDAGVDIRPTLVVGGYDPPEGQEQGKNGNIGLSLPNGTGNKVAKGSGSLAMGQGAVALGRNQSVMGRYAETNTTDIFALGVGTNKDNRQTALRADVDGNATFYGGVMYIVNSQGERIPLTIESGCGDSTQTTRTLHLK